MILFHTAKMLLYHYCFNPAQAYRRLIITISRQLAVLLLVSSTSQATHSFLCTNTCKFLPLKVINRIIVIFLLTFISPAPLWAVEPDALLVVKEKALRDLRYKEKAEQLAEMLANTTDEKEKHNLQLQQQLLTKLQEIPEKPEWPSTDLQFPDPAGEITLPWPDFQQFLDRSIKVIMEEKVSEQNLKDISKQQQTLYNELVALDDQEAEQDVLQLQYAYQVRKNDHQSLIARQLKQAVQKARQLFPKILERVDVDRQLIAKHAESLDMSGKNVQQLMDKRDLADAEIVALIEQQESIVAGYLGRELTDSDKKVMHFEMLKLLEQQVRKLSRNIELIETEIIHYGEQQLAGWYQLLSKEPNFFTLTDTIGDISKQLVRSQKLIKEYHGAIYAFEKELSTLRGGNALTGPRAKELIAKIDEEIRKIFTDLSGAGQRADILEIQGQLLSRAISLKQSAIGSVMTKTREATDDLLESGLAVLKYPLISYSGMKVSLLLLLQVLALLLFGIVSNRLFGYVVLRMGKKRNWTERTVHLVQAGGKYPLILMVAMIILSVVGINTSSLALVAGALSLGIGFGMQTIVNNLVSGIILLFDKSIRPGDFISLDENSHPGGFKGNVVQMNIRATVLRTNDNINIIIPNADLMASKVVNWTYSDERVRFRVPFAVAYGTDIDRLKELIKDALETLPIVLSHPEPQIWMAEHGESSLAFIAAIWVEGQSARQPSRTMDVALTAIYQTLHANNIEIPFPQVDLRLRDSDSKPRECRAVQTMVQDLFPTTRKASPPSVVYQQ
ncbi:MAG: mechanosensitive ion channel family protein [Desulforhopalus sp.]